VVFGSVCSGIEAASVAWAPLAWRAAFVSEIDPFARAVLAHRHPSAPLHGDFTTIQSGTYGAIDLLVGGTPCQSFSIAGLRGGLDDERGNLALEYLRLAQRLRPRWLVWENVPGVLSSNGGRDFGAMLGGMVELGYGFAYRVLDAQFFGVAQRRRRVFVVGHLGDWRRAAAVLFERHSLQGHPAPRREKRQTAPTLPSRSTAGGGLGTDFELDGGLIPEVAHTLRGQGFDASEDGTGRGTPLIAQAFSGKSSGKVDVAGTLLASGGWKGDFETETLVVEPHALAFAENSRGELRPEGGTGQVCGAMSTGGGRPGQGTPMVIAFTAKDYGGDAANNLSPTLRAGTHDQSHANGGVTPAIAFHASQDPDVSGDLAAPLGAKTNGMSNGVLAMAGNFSTTTDGASYVNATKTGPVAALRALRLAVGEEAFAVWSLGIIASLLPTKILQQALHGTGFRYATFSNSWLVHCALSRSEAGCAWLLQSLRETGCKGCPPQGWQPSQQLVDELRAYLSELSQPGAQAARFMHSLRLASEGPGILQQALSAVQEVGQRKLGQGQPAQPSAVVRRLTAEECEFLQGFPRGYTAIPWRGKPADQCPDGPRYKALGNSMAVPVMAWIGRRIQQADSL
jgi:DNA (cytosine-5)-methyltransferase 1